MTPPPEDEPLVRAQAWAHTLRTGARLVHLATAGPDGAPEASLVPAIMADDGVMIVLVSGLARHTANLRSNPRASVLMADADNEVARRNPLATPRITLRCRVDPLPRESSEWPAAMGRFHAGFGETIAVLSALPDFGCFRLQSEHGRLVAGFGQAFDVDPRDWTKLSRLAPAAQPKAPGR